MPYIIDDYNEDKVLSEVTFDKDTNEVTDVVWYTQRVNLLFEDSLGRQIASEKDVIVDPVIFNTKEEAKRIMKEIVKFMTKNFDQYGIDDITREEFATLLNDELRVLECYLPTTLTYVQIKN